MSLNKIPYGHYCYEILSVNENIGRIKVKLCPYWNRDYSKPEQMNGYCSYLKCGDWEHEGLGLLWDQVKECGINEECEEEDI